MPHLVSYFRELWEVVTVSVPILQMRKQMLRKVK